MKTGTIVKLKLECLGNNPETTGVVFEEYDLGEPGGSQVIFENGEYCGFSPDEQKVVTTGQDGVAIVWSLNKKSGDPQEQSPHFRGHQGPVYTAAFSPDGNSVVSGGYDKRVLIWKINELTDFEYEKIVANELMTKDEEKEIIKEPKFQALDHHAAAVRSVTYSHDGKRILSRSHDNTVKVWDATTGGLLKTLRGHDSWVRCCAFSPDGRWVLSGSHDRMAKQWSIDLYEEVRRVPQGRVLEGHSSDILSASFSTDEEQALALSPFE